MLMLCSSSGYTACEIITLDGLYNGVATIANYERLLVMYNVIAHNITVGDVSPFLLTSVSEFEILDCTFTCTNSTTPFIISHGPTTLYYNGM